MNKIALLVLLASVNAWSETKITLTGSSTIAPLMVEVGKAFEAKNPGLRVDVQSGGSSRGISDARQGTANIGMVSRDLKSDEKDLTGVVIARDGIGIILHKNNSVKELSEQQIISIYTGKISNWQDVGGANAPITVVNKAEGRSTLELFLHFFKLKNTDIKASVIIGDNQQGIKTVAGNPNAIGYVSIGSAEAEIESKVTIKLLPLNGVAATTENVKNGTFPLSRNLLLITKTAPGGFEKKLIEFAKSKEANQLVQEQFFVPISL